MILRKTINFPSVGLCNVDLLFFCEVGTEVFKFFFLMPPHVHTKFRGPPFWLWWNCNRLLRLGRPWGAVTLSWWCEGWYIGRWGAMRGLKSRSTNYPVHGHHGDPPPTRKIPMIEPGIEPVTLWLLTYLLTPWSRVLLEKLTGSAASQEIPRIFGTRKFLTLLTSARHLSLSWANSLPLPEDPS